MQPVSNDVLAKTFLEAANSFKAAGENLGSADSAAALSAGAQKVASTIPTIRKVFAGEDGAQIAQALEQAAQGAAQLAESISENPGTVPADAGTAVEAWQKLAMGAAAAFGQPPADSPAGR